MNGKPRVPSFRYGDRVSLKTLESRGAKFHKGDAFVKEGDRVFEFEKFGRRWRCSGVGSYSATGYYDHLFEPGGGDTDEPRG